MIKLDCEGHALDHTVVGQQSMSWDVAGAIVQRGLDTEEIATLLRAIRQADEAVPERCVPDFHCAAYAAFRMGMRQGLRERGGQSGRPRAATVMAGV